MENYVGKIVFVEARGSYLDGHGRRRDASSYYNGEYLCVRQTPFNLYCAKLAHRQHDTGEEKIFPLKGESYYEVIEATAPPAGFLKEHVRELREFAAEINASKKNWVDHVYTKAARMADVIERLIPQPETPSVDLTHVTVNGRMYMLVPA